MLRQKEVGSAGCSGGKMAARWMFRLPIFAVAVEKISGEIEGERERRKRSVPADFVSGDGAGRLLLFKINPFLHKNGKEY